MKSTVFPLSSQYTREIERDLFACQGIQRSERLVHQDDRRIVDQRPAKGDPLPHSA